MKFTLNWLKDHLDTKATLEEICDTLTVTGLEVEGVDDPAEKFAAYVIGEVLDASPHPDADKLQVLKVDTGSGTSAGGLRRSQCPQRSKRGIRACWNLCVRHRHDP